MLVLQIPLDLTKPPGTSSFIFWLSGPLLLMHRHTPNTLFHPPEQLFLWLIQVRLRNSDPSMVVWRRGILSWHEIRFCSSCAHVLWWAVWNPVRWHNPKRAPREEQPPFNFILHGTVRWNQARFRCFLHYSYRESWVAFFSLSSCKNHVPLFIFLAPKTLKYAEKISLKHS